MVSGSGFAAAAASAGFNGSFGLFQKLPSVKQAQACPSANCRVQHDFVLHITSRHGNILNVIFHLAILLEQKPKVCESKATAANIFCAVLVTGVACHLQLLVCCWHCGLQPASVDQVSAGKQSSLDKSKAAVVTTFVCMLQVCILS